VSELINTLRDSRDIYSEKLRQLLLNFQKHPQALFCVYEGEDAKYYGIRIDNLTAIEERQQIPCKGKADVLKLYDRVQSDKHFSRSNTIFFVDNDFDGARDCAVTNNLYITPCYSIENMYVRENSLKRIFTEEFGVDSFNDSDELEALTTLYTRLLNEFIESIRTLNAWIALQREKESPSCKLNLNNQKLNKFVSISLSKVDQLYSKDDLSILFPESVEITDNELHAKEEEFKQLDQSCVYRGKYFIEFLRVFLDLLKSDRQSGDPEHFTQKKNVKLNLSRVNIISELSQYAETPDCLRGFLDKVKQSYQKNVENLTNALNVDTLSR